MRKEKVCVVWLERNLRLQDNYALFEAVKTGHKVVFLYIFDPEILEEFSLKDDRRISYIHYHLTQINQTLNGFGANIIVMHQSVFKSFEDLQNHFDIQQVFAVRDYEPKRIKRNEVLRGFLNSKGIGIRFLCDRILIEVDQIVKKDSTAYKVYGHYAKAYKKELAHRQIKNYKVELSRDLLLVDFPWELPSLQELGFIASQRVFAKITLEPEILKEYAQSRDIPALDATSHIGIALVYGTLSIRECFSYALKYSSVWLDQLIWREFFIQILYHFPLVELNCFKDKYQGIVWRNNLEEFELWCQGKTGYPLVDAGIRELRATGFMQNRVRMVVASFLCKHLLIDYRWGEAFFAQYLMDYELASNNGNWQWCSSTGCDSVPYFRIFNPTLQAKRFDPDNTYIEKWVPEAFTKDYCLPIVDHQEARLRAIQCYKNVIIP
ncbi:cryptochrome/photolyase family protein [Myroides sp. LJL115]